MREKEAREKAERTAAARAVAEEKRRIDKEEHVRDKKKRQRCVKKVKKKLNTA